MQLGPLVQSINSIIITENVIVSGINFTITHFTNDLATDLTSRLSFVANASINGQTISCVGDETVQTVVRFNQDGKKYLAILKILY